MPKPFISIVIPVFNGSNYLRSAIDSVLNQSYENCEVIVVNDGSNDDGATEAIAESYGNKIKYYSKSNGGVASALNYGIGKMTGEYFSWLSHDDVLYHNKIEEEIQALQNSGAGLVFCSYDILKNSGSISHINLTDHFEEKMLISGVFPVLNAMIQFGGVLFHKNIFTKYGLFREDLRTTQDFEFLFRVLKGEKSCFVDKILYAVRYHEQQGSNTIDSVLTDADDMFMMFLNDIEDRHKIDAYGSVYNYYYRMYLNIYPQKHLVKSMKSCLEHLHENIGAEHAWVGNNDSAEYNAKSCMDSLIDVHSNVFIFGCGNYGKRLKKDLELRGIKVAGFLDNNPAMQGETIEGSICHTLDSIYARRDRIIIIVAALVVNDIVKELYDKCFVNVITKKDIDIAGMNFPVLCSKGYEDGVSALS